MKIPPREFEGFCLVASPSLRGSVFEHSLILITHHEPKEGSLGVIFNKSTRYKVGDFLDNVSPGLANVPVYNGGPVDTTVLTIIALYYTGNSLMIKSHLTPPMADEFLAEHPQSQIRAYLGYAGWSSGQLDSEIEDEDWALMPFTPALLEPLPADALWKWASEQIKF